MNIFKKLIQLLLDTVFPVACLGCGREGQWLCSACLKKILLNRDLTCPLCHAPTHGATCWQCKSSTPLDGLLIAAAYENQLIQTLVHTLKYQCIQEVAGVLGNMLANFVQTFDRKYQPAILHCPSEVILTPVPLHKKRLLERGFNQSELLAKAFNQYYNFSLQPNLLKRQRYTEAQAQLKKREREDNLREAFSLGPPFNLSNKTVIIVDDVATTLTTLNECAKVLKQARCKKVWGLVIARGT